jgi:hypothetical protein
VREHLLHQETGQLLAPWLWPGGIGDGVRVRPIFLRATAAAVDADDDQRRQLAFADQAGGGLVDAQLVLLLEGRAPIEQRLAVQQVKHRVALAGVLGGAVAGRQPDPQRSLVTVDGAGGSSRSAGPR